jgi:SAM-dependent methyltransferase
MKKAKKFDKYLYYENSVQTPEEHVHIFERMFQEQRKRTALSLREDFCGTFLISCEWVKSHPKRTSIGVDLDPETLQYGRAHGYKKISKTEQKRIRLIEQDVCTPTKQKVDVIGAGNFSFYIFKERAQLKKYFKAAFQSLNSEGIFVLEMAGGPGFIKIGREQKTYTVKELGRYTYYWHQKSFDPLTHYGMYAIHFKTPDGVLHKDAFTYDWRVWTIPEMKDLMKEVGFKDAVVYWEASDRDGDGTGEYLSAQTGDNAYSWIAFVVGVK